MMVGISSRQFAFRCFNNQLFYYIYRLKFSFSRTWIRLGTPQVHQLIHVHAETIFNLNIIRVDVNFFKKMIVQKFPGFKIGLVG